ncbi:hypothetical protein I6L58_00880 [Enterobacter cancerogenus]|jgi:hypothetical protein|uniref:Uncharacterized protein n=1 Tax=Enterobacter cancerogenus TaxID=69218 RepID=A0ABX8KLI0_9ENTR|nr:hypothetical protein [Enterobacter cancerogenus]QXA49634.1 hypothetical protein I6L58_00880 [Enterobacter cancerogenus]
MKVNILRLFRNKNELQEDFPLEQFNALLGEKFAYPLFLSLEKKGVYAYSARFMVKHEDISVIEYLIELFFHGKIKIKEEKESVVDHNKSLVCYKFKEFGRDIIQIITNDNEFIKVLCEKGLEPPGPENIFPVKNFSHYGSLQGDIACWWNIYWEPFWESLSECGKKHYLGRSAFSVETIEFLEYRH